MAYPKISRLHVISKPTVVESRTKLGADLLERRARQIRRELRKGLSKSENELANICRDLGFDYGTSREKVLGEIPKRLEGKRISNFTLRALAFLKENYDVKQVMDSDTRFLLHFPNPKEQGDFHMKMLSEIAESVKEPKKVVRVVYDGLVEFVKSSLKEERFIRLPGIGRMRLSYRPARPKRKGMNPFTKKEQWFKAKKASNKLRFSPSKDLKDFVKELPVVEKKKKKKKVVHHHHSKSKK